QRTQGTQRKSKASRNSQREMSGAYRKGKGQGSRRGVSFKHMQGSQIAQGSQRKREARRNSQREMRGAYRKGKGQRARRGKIF
ncbi:MAG: hypothetical protein IJM40_01115, partial [Synergistaceae bacterium]|nr:hypothetical protein [Synergistaceae bacterium]